MSRAFSTTSILLAMAADALEAAAQHVPALVASMREEAERDDKPDNVTQLPRPPKAKGSAPRGRRRPALHPQPEDVAWLRRFLAEHPADGDDATALYFIRCSVTERVKVGRARDPIGRLSALQVGSGSRLDLLAALDGHGGAEGAFHTEFAEWRRHGEWFDPSEAVMRAVRGARFMSATTRRSSRRRPKLHPMPTNGS